MLTERTIDWEDGDVVIIDQTLLPHREERIRLRFPDEMADAIRSLRVRGAPALGAAGALGVALAAVRAKEAGEDVDDAVRQAAVLLLSTRPTAVNLARGVATAVAAADGGVDAVVAAACGVLDRIDAVTIAIGARGADLLAELVGGSTMRLLTHCNAGALACVGWGTALGVVGTAFERGLVARVLTCETRPLLQGARLTAWELDRMGAPFDVLVDGAAAGLIVAGEVDAVVVGADRIAANGDVANKVGTYGLALAARAAGIPFVIAGPTSSIDPALDHGDAIEIEERSADEVLAFGGASVAPPGTAVRNPAFDVTPADLVTAIVTESRTIRPASGDLP